MFVIKTNLETMHILYTRNILKYVHKPYREDKREVLKMEIFITNTIQ